MEKIYSHYQERKKLADMLPLETPLSVHICPSTYCNFKCKYCRHGVSMNKDINGLENEAIDENINKSFMDLELYKEIIRQLSEFPQKLKLFNFAWLGEPLLHPNIAEMVSIAKQANIAERVEIVSNASMLTPELSNKLIEAGLDRLRISLQGINEEDYWNISKYKIDFLKFVDNIKYFYKHKTNTELYVKIMDAMIKDPDREKVFQELFKDNCDYLNIEYLVPLVKDLDITDMKENMDVGYFGNNIVSTSVCSQVFYMLIITPDGIVLPCCEASKYNDKLGKITKDNSIVNMWNGDMLRKIRIEMLTGNISKNEVCNSCAIPKYQTASSDYLDNYKDDLLNKYSLYYNMK